mgnify:CR=1 FL=1
MLLEELHNYASPASKLSRMTARGECVQIVKGLYETDKSVPGYLLAGSIYGPSYISFEYAMSYYGLIPEAVYTVTSATFEKKTFTYCDVPAEAFPLELILVQEGDYFYRIASPEKAVCDKLYTMSPTANIKELYTLLADDLRIDMDALKKLDQSKLAQLSGKYHSTNVKKLCSLIRRL